MLQLHPITLDNVFLALDAFHRIFTWLTPDTDPYTGILHGEMPELHARYYLVYDDETPVGITGAYQVPEDPESAFLGWFGVLPEMRRNHYGSKILRLHEEELVRLGYKYSRLYTEAVNNDATCAFYERNGYTREDYAPTAEPFPKGIIRTYSRTLGDWPLTPWNSRNLHLVEEAKMMYTEEQLKDPQKMIEEMQKGQHT